MEIAQIPKKVALEPVWPVPFVPAIAAEIDRDA